MASTRKMLRTIKRRGQRIQTDVAYLLDLTKAIRQEVAPSPRLFSQPVTNGPTLRQMVIELHSAMQRTPIEWLKKDLERLAASIERPPRSLARASEQLDKMLPELQGISNNQTRSHARIEHLARLPAVLADGFEEVDHRLDRQQERADQHAGIAHTRLDHLTESVKALIELVRAHDTWARTTDAEAAEERVDNDALLKAQIETLGNRIDAAGEEAATVAAFVHKLDADWRAAILSHTEAYRAMWEDVATIKGYLEGRIDIPPK